MRFKKSTFGGPVPSQKLILAMGLFFNKPLEFLGGQGFNFNSSTLLLKQ